MFIPSLAKTQENEEQYRIVFPAVEDTGLFDTSDIQQGIVLVCGKAGQSTAIDLL